MSPSEYDSLINNLKKLPVEFKALVEKRIELFTIEMAEWISGMIAHAVYRVTGIVFLALGLILVLFAAANFVGNILGNESLGFIGVSLPILLVGFLFFFRRPRSMVTRTRDKMMNQFIKDLTEQMSQFDFDEDNGNVTDPEASDTGEKHDREDSEKNTSSESEKRNN